MEALAKYFDDHLASTFRHTLGKSGLTDCLESIHRIDQVESWCTKFKNWCVMVAIRPTIQSQSQFQFTFGDDVSNDDKQLVYQTVLGRELQGINPSFIQDYEVFYVLKDRLRSEIISMLEGLKKTDDYTVITPGSYDDIDRDILRFLWKTDVTAALCWETGQDPRDHVDTVNFPSRLMELLEHCRDTKGYTPKAFLDMYSISIRFLTQRFMYRRFSTYLPVTAKCFVCSRICLVKRCTCPPVIPDGAVCGINTALDRTHAFADESDFYRDDNTDMMVYWKNGQYPDVIYEYDADYVAPIVDTTQEIPNMPNMPNIQNIENIEMKELVNLPESYLEASLAGNQTLVDVDLDGQLNVFPSMRLSSNVHDTIRMFLCLPTNVDVTPIVQFLNDNTQNQPMHYFRIMARIHSPLKLMMNMFRLNSMFYNRLEDHPNLRKAISGWYVFASVLGFDKDEDDYTLREIIRFMTDNNSMPDVFDAISADVYYPRKRLLEFVRTYWEEAKLFMIHSPNNIHKKQNYNVQLAKLMGYNVNKPLLGLTPSQKNRLVISARGRIEKLRYFGSIPSIEHMNNLVKSNVFLLETTVAMMPDSEEHVLFRQKLRGIKSAMVKFGGYEGNINQYAYGSPLASRQEMWAKVIQTIMSHYPSSKRSIPLLELEDLLDFNLKDLSLVSEGVIYPGWTLTGDRLLYEGKHTYDAMPLLDQLVETSELLEDVDTWIQHYNVKLCTLRDAGDQNFDNDHPHLVEIIMGNFGYQKDSYVDWTPSMCMMAISGQNDMFLSDIWSKIYNFLHVMSI